MSLETAIYQTMINNTDITDVVNQKIYPIVVPHDVEFPAITYTISSNDPDKSKGEASQGSNTTVQIKCIHESFEALKSMTDHVRLAFDNLKGDVYGCEIQATFYDGSIPFKDEESQVFVDVLLFNFHYKY